MVNLSNGAAGQRLPCWCPMRAQSQARGSGGLHGPCDRSCTQRTTC